MVDVKTNLLKDRRTLSEGDYQKERLYLRYSILGLVIVVICVIALSVWNYVLSRQLQKTEQSLRALAIEMQGLSEASAQQVYLASRLKLVSEFLGERALTSEALEKVLSTFLPGTHVGGVTFEEDDSLNVEFVSNSVGSLDRLLTYYQTDTGYFVQAVSRGLSRLKDGTYQMTITLVPPKGSQ